MKFGILRSNFQTQPNIMSKIGVRIEMFKVGTISVWRQSLILSLKHNFKKDIISSGMAIFGIFCANLEITMYGLFLSFFSQLYVFRFIRYYCLLFERFYYDFSYFTKLRIFINLPNNGTNITFYKYKWNM